MNQDQLRELNKLLCEYRERHIGWETKDKLMLTSINLAPWPASTNGSSCALPKTVPRLRD